MKKLMGTILAAGLLASAQPALALTATLSWTDNSNNEDGFKIYRASTIGGPYTEIGNVLSNVTTFSDPSTQPGNCYRVTAFNAAGESQPSNSACILVIPAAPSGVTLTLQ